MDKNITPIPPQKLSRSKRFLSWFIKETVGNTAYDGLLQLGGKAVKLLIFIGSFAAYLRYRLGVSLDALIILSLFMGAIVASIVARIIVRVLWPNDRVQESPQSSHDQSAPIVVKEPCSDEWLHKIADRNRKAITRYLKVEKCRLSGHALLDTAPYIDFSITLRNLSVFTLKIDESIQGSIDLNKQHLSKEVKLRVGVEGWGYASKAILIIRQWLSKEEAVCILNAMGDTDEFRFWHLKLTVKGYKESYQIEPSQPSFLHTVVPCSALRKHYPKLSIEIKGALFKDYWNWKNLDGQGLLISIYVRATNIRVTRVDIQKCRILVKVSDKDFVGYAESGELREYRAIEDEGQEILQGERLPNLIPPNSQIIPLDHEQYCEGWLQFIIRRRVFDLLNEGVAGEMPESLPATLTFIDPSGEVHHTECSLMYHKFDS